MAEHDHEAEREEEAQEEEEDDGQTEEAAVLIALVILLLAGLAFADLSRRVILLLAPLGIPAPAAVSVLTLIGAPGLTFPASVPAANQDPAEAFMHRTAVTRRARYILAAGRRLSTGGTIAAERRLLNAHLAAERGRVEGARVIDAAARKWGPLLGWNAVRDERTTMECYAAHGHNFLAATPPGIGWPGTLHGGNCRCIPVAPWPDGDLLL